MAEFIAFIITVFIFVGPIYLIIRFFQKRAQRKVKLVSEINAHLEKEIATLKAQLDNTSKNNKKELVFDYRQNDEVQRVTIIPYHKSDNFVEGYCLDSKRVDVYDIKNIVMFLEDTEPIFNALGRDPSLLTDRELDQVNDSKSDPTYDYSKGHRKWDENNPNEIFFRYRGSSGKAKDRVVRLINYEQGKINGYCNMANGLRTFNIDRIEAFYKDSEARLKKFRESPHHNRDVITISFIGFSNEDFEQYKSKGNIYNYRALKSVTDNTAIVVAENSLSPAQQKRAEKNSCAFISPNDFPHFLETGEV